MILKTTLLDTIANSIGYTVKKKSGYYMVVRPDCLTGRQCDTLQDVAECLASMIKGIHNKLNEKQAELESISEAHKEPSDSTEYWGKLTAKEIVKTKEFQTWNKLS